MEGGSERVVNWEQSFRVLRSKVKNRRRDNATQAKLKDESSLSRKKRMRRVGLWEGLDSFIIFI